MATLELTSLHCKRKQDVTGKDEPRITVDGNEKWSGVMEKDETKNLVPTNIPFTGKVVVRLDEMNGDNPTPIGGALVVSSTGAGPQPHDFKTSGAHYQLYYRVS